MPSVKIGEKLVAVQGFAGQRFSYSHGDEITVDKNNMDNCESWLRGGLVEKTTSFLTPEPAEGKTIESPGILPVRNIPRARGRGRFTPPDGG